MNNDENYDVYFAAVLKGVDTGVGDPNPLKICRRGQSMFCPISPPPLPKKNVRNRD